MQSRRFHLNWFTGSSLAFAAVITIFCAMFLSSLRGNDAPLSTASALPDAYMEDVVALVLDKQGKPKMKIISPKMVYYAKDDKTLLTTPQLTLYRKSPQPWYITSQFAEATQGTEHVLFKEQVVIQHAADINNPATVIKTTTLLVHPTRRLRKQMIPSH